MKKTQSQITYDKVAPFYRQISEERGNYLLGVDKIISAFIVGKKSLVDLGSGDGIHIAKLSKRAKINNIVLVDNSHEMFRLSKLIPGVRVEKSSIVNFTPKEKFEVVTCLWNVLGHMESVGDVKKVIINIDKNILKINGLLLLDVNNKYNVFSYGLWRVVKNIISDIFNPNKNKYAEFYKNISCAKIKMRVHFSTPYEIENYIKETSLKIIKKLYINYETGKIENSFWKGQILYIIEKI